MTYLVKAYLLWSILADLAIVTGLGYMVFN
jgi:hypothetical protein